MVDYKALKGDPTDNIPGVPGVGEATAAKLIREFGDLDSLFARLDDVTPEKLRDKLRDHREQIYMGRELSTIVRDLPISIDLEAALLGDYDRDTVVRLFREYEFRHSSSACRRWPARPPNSAPRPFGPSPRAATCRPHASPVGRKGGAQAVPRIARGGFAPARLRCAPKETAPVQPARIGRSSRPMICRPRWPPRSSIPAIEVVGEDGVAGLESWLAAQPTAGVSILLDDPRPRRGVLALAVVGTDGRTVAADGQAASAAAASPSTPPDPSGRP